MPLGVGSGIWHLVALLREATVLAMIGIQDLIIWGSFGFVVVTIPLYATLLFVIWRCIRRSSKEFNAPFFKLVFAAGIVDIGKC